MRHVYLQEQAEAAKWEKGAKKDKNVDKETKRQEQLALDVRRSSPPQRPVQHVSQRLGPESSKPNRSGNYES